MTVGKDVYKDREVVKKMAQLMMQGAVMLSETCPMCGLPLFRLRNGDIVCPIHGRIILVRSEEEARDIEVDAIVRDLEHYAARKIQALMEEGDPAKILEWLRVIEAGERIRELREKRKTTKSVEASRGESPRGAKSKRSL